MKCQTWLVINWNQDCGYQQPQICWWYHSNQRRQWHPTPVLLLENTMNRGAWCTAVHGVAKSHTWLSNWTDWPTYLRYLRLLIFLPAVLILAFKSSNPAFHMMCSVYKLNKQDDNKQPCCTPFSILNQSVVPYRILTVASWPTYRFHRRQIRWSQCIIKQKNLWFRFRNEYPLNNPTVALDSILP